MAERTVVDLPNFRQQIGKYTIGPVEFMMYYGMRVTVERAEEMIQRDPGKLIRAYAFITGDDRSALPMRAVKQALLGEVQLGWYRIMGIDIPPKVKTTQEDRMTKAQATTATAEATAAPGEVKEKAPRVTNRSIIENGLLAGKSDEAIIAEVKAKFPDGKADNKHVGYYRHFLIKGGKLEKPAKVEKPKKEKVAKGEKAEVAPAAQQKSASAEPAQAKAGVGRSQAKPGREAASTAKGGKR